MVANVKSAYPVAITIDSATNRDAAAALLSRLAAKLGLPVYRNKPLGDYPLWLIHAHDRLALRDGRNLRVGPVFAEFKPLSKPIASCRQLRQAIGKNAHRVVDATAGLGGDAWLLASLGYDVLALERHPLIYALLEDAWHHATEAGHTTNQRLRFQHGDAISLLPTLTPTPEVIYLDPMFPPKRRRSTAVRKEIRLMRILVGDDEDTLRLFELALTTATARVVVKRPDHAPPLTGTPTFSCGGKLVRFDVYQKPHRRPYDTLEH
jgi:16S rRNA (guanine1516-N2)-methyltransferase